MRHHRSARLLALCLSLFVTAPALVLGQEDSVPGVDMSSLSPEQRAEAMKIFRENKCNCGCGMTILDCRTKDPNCQRSPAIAREVVQLLGQGKPSAEVVKTAFASPTPPPAPPTAAAGGGSTELVFDVPVGDSYYTGPENAPVTLVSWLDYQ